MVKHFLTISDRGIAFIEVTKEMIYNKTSIVFDPSKNRLRSQKRFLAFLSSILGDAKCM